MNFNPYELKPGDAHTVAGVLDFLKAFFAKVPSSAKVIIIRAYNGFYDHKTIEYLESKKALFAIVARLTPLIIPSHQTAYLPSRDGKSSHAISMANCGEMDKTLIRCPKYDTQYSEIEASADARGTGKIRKSADA